MKEQFLDCLGIPFAEHTEWLAPSTRDWPWPFVTELPKVLSDWRAQFAGTPCWWCGEKTTEGLGNHRGELHHLHGAGGKKINEPWLFCWLDWDCHQGHGEAVKAESLGRLLYLKWKHDAAHVWWQGIALRLRRRLPDLQVDLPARSTR